MSVRIGVDVGGTFTDIVCWMRSDRTLGLLEVPTTPDHPEGPNRAVVDGH